MIYSIIILAICVIVLFFSKQSKPKKEDGLDRIKQMLKYNKDMCDNIEKKRIRQDEIRELIKQSQIDSIIGKDDRLIQLLKLAKEKGYFNKPFSPLNSDDSFMYHDNYIELKNNEIGECLFISSKRLIPLGCFPSTYQLHNMEYSSCIYQNGKWAEIEDSPQERFDKIKDENIDLNKIEKLFKEGSIVFKKYMEDFDLKQNQTLDFLKGSDFNIKSKKNK